MTKEEAILEARRKFDAGEFRRAITGRKPKTFYWDDLTLECGHAAGHFPKLHPETPAYENCINCANEWIEQAAKQ